MKVFTISLAAVVLGLGSGAQAGLEMRVDFPGALMPRAEVLVTNLMTFSGALGGFSPPAITQSSNPSRIYQVDGDLFDTFRSAWQRSCSKQKNLCSDNANSDAGRSAGITVSMCDSQNSDCDKAVETQSATAFATFATQDANYDYYCEG